MSSAGYTKTTQFQEPQGTRVGIYILYNIKNVILQYICYLINLPNRNKL